MTDQIARDKILQRVLNLRARAQSDGSSEAEMNASLNMAAKLMATYQIEEAELAIAENEGRIVLDIVTKLADASCLKNKHRHPIVTVLGGIGAFTQTMTTYNDGSGAMTFTGHRPDTEVANYLASMIREALDREFDIYKARNGSLGRGGKASFQNAMARRVCVRLWRMAETIEAEREEEAQKALSAPTVDEEAAARLAAAFGRPVSIAPQEPVASFSTSMALVILEAAQQKAKATQEAYEAKFPKLNKFKDFQGGKNARAHAAGRAAGDRLNLGQVIESVNTGRIGA